MWLRVKRLEGANPRFLAIFACSPEGDPIPPPATASTPLAGRSQVDPLEEMPAKFRRAARRRERELGRSGFVISTEMIAATEPSAQAAIGSAGLPPVAVAPPSGRRV